MDSARRYADDFLNSMDDQQTGGKKQGGPQAALTRY